MKKILCVLSFLFVFPLKSYYFDGGKIIFLNSTGYSLGHSLFKSGNVVSYRTSIGDEYHQWLNIPLSCPEQGIDVSFPRDIPWSSDAKVDINLYYATTTPFQVYLSYNDTQTTTAFILGALVENKSLSFDLQDFDPQKKLTLHLRSTSFAPGKVRLMHLSAKPSLASEKTLYPPMKKTPA